MTDESYSISTTSSQICHAPSSPRIDSSTTNSEIIEQTSNSSPTKRYNSPIFENLLPVPIEPVKVTRVLSIPNDNAIDNLLEVVSLVANVTKTISDDEKLIKTNTTEITNENDDDENNESEMYNEWTSLDKFAEKRPSFQDPEIVLMQNVVPGNKN